GPADAPVPSRRQTHHADRLRVGAADLQLFEPAQWPCVNQMKLSNDKILTPFFLKSDPDMPWPKKETVFYLMTADGLFQCRNHRFFRSSVLVNEWPAELAAHRPFLKLYYPKISRRLFERLVGFVAHIGDRYGAEAAALLVWNECSQRIEAIVPE